MAVTVRAKTGAGCALYQGDGGSPENFNKLAQILTLKWSSMKQASEKVTNQDSQTDQYNNVYQELLGTIVDPGMIELTLNWVPGDATHQLLLSHACDGAVHDFQIRGPVNIGSSPSTRMFTFRFSAQLFDRPDIDLPLDKAMTLTVKLQLIGVPGGITYNDPVNSN
jgi:hypothetical protein